MFENSPQGDPNTNFSGFHKQLPDPQLLKMYLEEKKHPAIPKCHPLLKELLIDLRNKNLLDLGCGLGSTFSKLLLELGLKAENLYSLDPDSKNFQKDEYLRINKIIASAEKIPLQDNFFDIVHSSEMTIDNLSIDYLQVLKEISRVLKPAGIYLANEHFEENLEVIKEKLSLLKTNDSQDKHLPLLQQNFKQLQQKAEGFLKILNDSKLLQEIGFKPLLRIKYLQSPILKPGQFTFYLLEKK